MFFLSMVSLATFDITVFSYSISYFFKKKALGCANNIVRI